MTIGILIPDLENVFCTRIITTVENILSQYGYSIIICDYQESEKREKDKLNFLINKMVDGIIFMPSGQSKDMINDVIDKNIPIVLIDRILNGVSCDAVLVDNLNASYAATRELIIRGHKRIGIICGPEKIYTSQERLKGYLRVHEDYQMNIDNSLIKFGDYKTKSGYELLKELLKLNEPPTVIYVTNYNMTLGAIIAINEMNIKIPDELSLVGFDSLDMALIYKPSLSIVVQPMEEIGKITSMLLIKRLSGDNSDFPKLYRLKAEVIIKDSVKKMH